MAGHQNKTPLHLLASVHDSFRILHVQMMMKAMMLDTDMTLMYSRIIPLRPVRCNVHPLRKMLICVAETVGKINMCQGSGYVGLQTFDFS